MSLRVGEVVIDCAEHGAVVDFWQAALDYERQEVNEQYVGLAPEGARDRPRADPVPEGARAEADEEPRPPRLPVRGHGGRGGAAPGPGRHASSPSARWARSRGPCSPTPRATSSASPDPQASSSAAVGAAGVAGSAAERVARANAHARRASTIDSSRMRNPLTGWSAATAGELTRGRRRTPTAAGTARRSAPRSRSGRDRRGRARRTRSRRAPRASSVYPVSRWVRKNVGSSNTPSPARNTWSTSPTTRIDAAMA